MQLYGLRRLAVSGRAAIDLVSPAGRVGKTEKPTANRAHLLASPSVACLNQPRLLLQSGRGNGRLANARKMAPRRGSDLILKLATSATSPPTTATYTSGWSSAC